MWHTNLDGVDFSSYKAFKNSVIGQGWNLDGYYGAQCWDGCDMLYRHIGRVFRTSSYYGGDGGISSTWEDTRCRAYNGAEPMSVVTDLTKIKKGDLVIFSRYYGGGYGHGGYANSDYAGSNNIEILSQNYRNYNLTNGSPFSLDVMNLTYFLGAFRWSGWNGGDPGPNPPDPTPGYGSSTFPHGKFPWVLMAHRLRARR